jgi:hypothetical protein
VLGGPQVAFPSEAPSLPSGPGGVAWASDAAGCPSAGSGASAITLAATGAEGRPTVSSTAPLPGALAGDVAAVGGTFGRLTIATGVQDAGSPGRSATVLQGRSTAPLGAPELSQPGSVLALSRAYLGDVALATVEGSSIAVRVERHYMHHFGPPRLIPIPGGGVSALVAAMDFRSDVLVAWQQGSSVYAHMLRASERADPTQRVGRSAANPQLQALVSDNDHGVVAWSSAAQASGSRATRTYVNLSGPGVRFGSPRRIASFPDPAGFGAGPGSLALARLSTENVVLFWTDAEQGHYVVRGAQIVAAAAGAATSLSDPHAQSVLAGLAPGADGEAIALWTSPPGGHAAARAPRTQLWAARTLVVPHNRLVSAPAQMIAAPGPLEEVSVAVDPRDDRPLVAWRARPDPRGIGYAVGEPARGAGAAALAAHRRAARALVAATRPAPATPWWAIALGCCAAVAVIAGAAIHRRRRALAAGRRRDTR